MPGIVAREPAVTVAAAASCARTRLSRLVIVASIVCSTLGLSACFPLIASGVAVGALAFLDRRSIGAQADDQSIELKARNRMRQQLADASGVSATSYNRRVLLTGQVISDADKQAAGAIIAGLESVRGVYNELELKEQPTLQVTSSDVGITTRVKTALLRDDVVPGNSVKVKTEGGVVYLMGLTTTDEAQRAAEIASRTAGVTRVITVFEIISSDEARAMSRAAESERTGSPGTPGTSGNPVTPADAAPPDETTPPGTNSNNTPGATPPSR